MGNFVSKKLGRGDESAKRSGVRASTSATGTLVDRPIFHVKPESGWMNDPNGPIFVNGRYHLFYQHVPDKSVWDFGIVWGHASSTDLINWELHPHAIEPTFGEKDADGCFSGCCAIDDDGSVRMLYTGVRKRDNPNCGPLPPPDQDLGLIFIESQLVATAVPGDDKLINWTKQLLPAIPLPPKNLTLTGWRDPFVLPRGPLDDTWTMLIASGIKDQGGAVMVYKSTSLTSGWYFDGFLASGNGETGAVWECPLLARLPVKSSQLPPLGRKVTSVGNDLYNLAREAEASLEMTKPGSRRSNSIDMTAFRIKTALEHIEDPGYRYFFCISPDAKENPVLYWLGNYRDGKFIIDEAKGPFFLDLGDVVYAPNILQDDKGNQTLWIWIRDFEMEEAPKRGNQGFSGCLSTPRRLFVKNGRLFQEPAPEVLGLRKDVEWKVQDVEISLGKPMHMGKIKGQAIDMEITFMKGSSSAMGIVLHSFKPGYENVAIFYSWRTSSLDVVVDPVGFFPDAEGTRRTGGVLRQSGGDFLTLRVLIDFSCIEIFTHTGEVLTTRVYRGPSSPTCNPGIDFVALGGSGNLTISAYECKSIWDNTTELCEKPNNCTETLHVEKAVDHNDVQSTQLSDHPWWSFWSGIPADVVIH